MKSEQKFVLAYVDSRLCVQVLNETYYRNIVCFLNSDQVEDILEFTDDIDYCIEVSPDVRKQV